MKFEPNITYNFETLAPAILGTQFKSAVCQGTVGYTLAMSRENIDVRYRQIYPVLPVGTPDSPKKQEYTIFKTESGKEAVLCHQWIKEDTIRVVTAVDFEVRFTNALPEDLNTVRDLLLAAGYQNFIIS